MYWLPINYEVKKIRALLAIIVLGVATKIALDLLVEPNEIFNISVIRALF